MSVLLIEQLPKFENKRIRLAQAIGMTPSRLTRAIKGEYSLDVPNCLRLAIAAKLPPSDVLRAAGKAETAALIERAYGPRNEAALTAAEREHLDQWRNLSDRARESIEALMNDLHPPAQTTTLKKRKSA